MLCRYAYVNWCIKYEWVPELKNLSIQAVGYIMLCIILSSIYKPDVMYFLMFWFQLFYLAALVGKVLFIGWWHRQYIIVNWKLWGKWKWGQGRVIFPLVSTVSANLMCQLESCGSLAEEQWLLVMEILNYYLIGSINLDWETAYKLMLTTKEDMIFL